MEKEYIVNSTNVITLNITDGKVDSYREKDETKSTVRAYEDGKIGIAGALGEPNFEELEQQAVANLANGIAYPCKLNKNTKKSIIRDKAAVEEAELMQTTKRLARKIATACPRFLINGKTKLTRVSGSYKNTQGTELAYENGYFNIFFQLKDRDSSNIADAYYGSSHARFGKVSEDKVVNDMKTFHDAFFGEKVTLPDGKYPVIVQPIDVFNNILRDFIAERYVSGGSLFNGKLGEKICNEKLSLYADRNPVTNYSTSFYDGEGELAPDYRAPIVENGVMKNVLTTKDTAETFRLPVSKTASMPYDGVPGLAISGIYMKHTAPDLATLLGSEKAIYIAITSGGDITTEGVVGMPVQLAFLVENGKITKRLTDFSASGNIKEMLGEDFIGVSAKNIQESDSDELMVTRMNIING